MQNDKKRECDSHDEKYYKKLTIPNVLTVFRMISSVALFSYIAMYGITSPLMVTLAALGIGATDAVDGYLARNFDMKSQLGSVLDPIADKIYNWGMALTLMGTGIMPLWPLAIGIRDIAVAGITSYQYKKNGKEMLPTIPAKVKMFLQSAGMISTLAFGFGTSGLSLIAPICMGSAIATVIPEIYCIRKKYFNKDNEQINIVNNDFIKQENLEEQNNNQKENSKTLEYNGPTIENVQEKQKVMQKTLFNNSIFRRKNNNNNNTSK